MELYLFSFGLGDFDNHRDPFEPVFPKGIHKNKIIYIECCPSKSIFVTLSEDKLCKMWQFSYTRGTFILIFINDLVTLIVNTLFYCMKTPIVYRCTQWHFSSLLATRKA